MKIYLKDKYLLTYLPIQYYVTPKYQKIFSKTPDVSILLGFFFVCRKERTQRELRTNSNLKNIPEM